MQMRIITICLLLCFANISGTAQDTLFTYFSKQFRPDSINLITVTVEPTDIGYLIAGIAGDEENMSFVKALDPQGNEIAQLIIDDDEFEHWLTSGQQMTKGLNDNEYWIAYSKNYGGQGELNQGDVVVAKVDNMANLLLYQELENPYNEALRAICKAHDGGLIITGWRQWEDGPTHIYVLKVDEEGNELWNYEYVDQPNHRTEVGYISPTSDGGYIIGGAWSPNIGISQIDTGYYIVKIDGDGIVQWKSKAPVEEGQLHGLMEVFELEDGGYLGHGNQQVSEGEISGIYINYLTLFDDNGSLLQEQFYDFNEPGFSHSWSGFGNNFIAYEDYFLTSTRYLNAAAQAQNRLWAITENLDTLWTKTIVLDPDTSIFLYDMEPTADGGVIMAGYTPYHTPQFGWALKLDSLSNTCSNLYHCDSLIIADTPSHNITNPSAFEGFAYPNPASKQVVFHHPPSMNGQEGVIRLFSIQGVLVKEIPLCSTAAYTKCSLRGLSSGIYPYHMQLQDGILIKGKLVVE